MRMKREAEEEEVWWSWEEGKNCRQMIQKLNCFHEEI